MATFSWSPDDDAWVAIISNDAFDSLEIRISTDGEASPPTQRQLQAVVEVEAMTTADITIINTLTRKYGEATLDSEDLEELEDEDFELEIQVAVIPRLRGLSDTFVVFVGDCGIDVEHGLGCVCKNGRQFAIVPDHYAYEDFKWDSIDMLEEVL